MKVCVNFFYFCHQNKIVKNAFYFTKKAPFVLNIFKFLYFTHRVFFPFLTIAGFIEKVDWW